MKMIKILVGILASLLILVGCNNEQANNSTAQALPYSIVKKEHEKELLEWNKEIVAIDYTVIDKFIERRKWNMEISGTGLYYQIYKNGDGEKSKDGKIAEFTYTVMLLNGDLLYSSDKTGNKFLHLGHNQQEAGINEGLLMMRVGDKARFILPPHLAFGVPGDGNLIPPYSIIIYDVELISLNDKID